MNLTQIIVYKHQEQHSFVCFFNTKAQCSHTCVVVLSPDSKLFYDIVYVNYVLAIPFLNIVKPHKLVFKRKYLFKSEAPS